MTPDEEPASMRFWLCGTLLVVSSFRPAAAQADAFEASFDSARQYARRSATAGADTCHRESYMTCLEWVEFCLSLDSSRTISEIRSNPAFDGVRDEYEIRRLTDNIDFYDPAFVRDFIVGKVFTTSAPGTSYYPISTLAILEDGTWLCRYHENAEELLAYWHADEQTGEAPVVRWGERSGRWKLQGHTLLMYDQKRELEQSYELTAPGQIGEYYYPDPNDESGRSEVRHYWKCGKCGCQ
jgi:hypothetical protein